jgi:hypothetical protein
VISHLEDSEELSRQLDLYVAGDPRDHESIFSWGKTPEGLIMLREKIIRINCQNRLQRLLAQVKGHRTYLWKIDIR